MLKRPGGARIAVAALLALATSGAACSGGANPGVHRSATRTGSAPAKPRAASTPAPARFPAVQLDGTTYSVPSPLPGASPGTVLAAGDHGPDSTFGGADRWVFLYHTVNVDGRDVAASATLFVPASSPPAGGWPVVAWAHGTTGIADRCAPSEAANLFYNEYAQEVRSFLAARYAVVAPDYIGLGTPGVHSYLIGVDEGNAVTDAVVAAHGLVPDLSTTWFAVGHSQGGQAALFTTRAAARASGLHLAGAVAIAPASASDQLIPNVARYGYSSVSAYALYALVGLSAVDPTVDPAQVLGPTAADQLPVVEESGCLFDAVAALDPIAASDVFSAGSDVLDRIDGELGAYDDPDRAATVGPVLVVQGESDADVPPRYTAAVVDNLRRLGSNVTEKTYPGLDHNGVLGPSVCDILGWMAAQGGAAVGPCTPEPTDLS